jgi:hypothetical protein
MQAIAEWGAALDPLWLRAVALLTTAIGAFLIVAVIPRKSER